MDAATARPRVVALDDAAGDDAGVIVEIHAAAVPDGVVADHAVVGEHAGDVRDTDAAAGVGRVVALHEIAQDARGALEHADAGAVVAAGVVGHAVVGEREGALVDVDAAAVVHRGAVRDRAAGDGRRVLIDVDAAAYPARLIAVEDTAIDEAVAADEQAAALQDGPVARERRRAHGHRSIAQREPASPLALVVADGRAADLARTVHEQRAAAVVLRGVLRDLDAGDRHRAAGRVQAAARGSGVLGDERVAHAQAASLAAQPAALGVLEPPRIVKRATLTPPDCTVSAVPRAAASRMVLAAASPRMSRSFPWTRRTSVYVPAQTSITLPEGAAAMAAPMVANAPGAVAQTCIVMPAPPAPVVPPTPSRRPRPSFRPPPSRHPRPSLRSPPSRHPRPSRRSPPSRHPRPSRRSPPSHHPRPSPRSPPSRHPHPSPRSPPSRHPHPPPRSPPSHRPTRRTGGATGARIRPHTTLTRRTANTRRTRIAARAPVADDGAAASRSRPPAPPLPCPTRRRSASVESATVAGVGRITAAPEHHPHRHDQDNESDRRAWVLPLSKRPATSSSSRQGLDCKAALAPSLLKDHETRCACLPKRAAALTDPPDVRARPGVVADGSPLAGGLP